MSGWHWSINCENVLTCPGRQAARNRWPARLAATGSLSHRILLRGRGDEFRELADAFDAMLARARSTQLTTNLVHNAIVHNLPDQGTVCVTTSVHPEHVELTVENTGERLTPQLVATLVEPFRRGTGRIRTEHAGVGLGLGIVKSIARAHDGALALTPRDAGGLCVTVQLPAAPAHADSQGF